MTSDFNVPMITKDIKRQWKGDTVLLQHRGKTSKARREKEDTQMLVTPEMESITNALEVEKGMVRLLA